MSLLQMQRNIKPENDQKPNLTGIPSYMKQDFETRSGLNYDDVRIHYSSPKPAELGALAYTQGTHIYIGPGQEKQLPHELVHVAQQKRGEVRPTGRLGNVSVNDDPELERQADEGIVVQRAQTPSGPAPHIIQRKFGMEYQTVGGKENVFVRKINENEETSTANDISRLFLFKTTTGITVTADSSDLEYVTPAVDKPIQAFKAGCAAAAVHTALKNMSKPQAQPPGVESGGEFNDNHEFVKGDQVYTFKNLGTTAHPQATVGIRMDKISDLLTDLGAPYISRLYNPQAMPEREPVKMDRLGMIELGLTSGKLATSDPGKITALLSEQKLTMLNAPTKAQEAVNKSLNKTKKIPTDYNSIVGLLALLFAYNEQFLIIAKNPEAALNAKNAMPVMSRTSLYDAYYTLCPADQTIFKDSIIEGAWVKVPDTFDSDASKSNVPNPNILKSNEPVIVRPSFGSTGINRPSANRPSANRPSAFRPSALRPSAHRPSALRPSALISNLPIPNLPKADVVKHPLAGQIILAGEFHKTKNEWEAISLDKWVAGLSNKVDVMYESTFDSVGRLATPKPGDPKEKEKEAELKNFGINISTDIGIKNVAGLLVELRGLGRGVDCASWGKVAGLVAYLVNCLNKGKNPKVSKLPSFLDD